MSIKHKSTRWTLLALFSLVLFLLPTLLLKAGITATPTYNPDGHATINRFVIPWTSASDGTAGGRIEKADGTAVQFNGTLLQVSIVPSNTGTPTNAYDAVVTSDQGIDMLGGLGANLSATVSLQETPITGTNSFPLVMVGVHTLSITNAGSAKSGTITLMVRDR